MDDCQINKASECTVAPPDVEVDTIHTDSPTQLPDVEHETPDVPRCNCSNNVKGYVNVNEDLDDTEVLDDAENALSPVSPKLPRQDGHLDAPPCASGLATSPLTQLGKRKEILQKNAPRSKRPRYTDAKPASAMSMTNLGLPKEILLIIFEMLPMKALFKIPLLNHECYNMANTILYRRYGIRALFRIARRGFRSPRQKDIIMREIKSGHLNPSGDIVDGRIRPPLMKALIHGQDEIALLLASTSDIDSLLMKAPTLDITSLSLAAVTGQFEVVMEIIARLETSDINWKTVEEEIVKAFGEAMQKPHFEKALLLIPKLNAVGRAKALYRAAEAGRGSIIQALLIDESINPHIMVSGYTPLSIAATGLLVNTVKILLSSNRVQVDYRDDTGRTALVACIDEISLICANGKRDALREPIYLEMVKLLLENGASPNAEDDDGVTAWSLVRRFGLSLVASLFRSIPSS